MCEIKQVTAIVSNPLGLDPNDHGRMTIGFYFVEDGLLTMTDGNGKPMRGAGGEKITHKLQAGDEADVIAKRLTMRIYRWLTGNDNGFMARPPETQPETKGRRHSRAAATGLKIVRF
jgi:hypothetical protein